MGLYWLDPPEAFTFFCFFSTLSPGIATLYDKKEINRLFESYITDGLTDETLWALLEACQPIVEYRLAKYCFPKNHREDFITDIKIKLFKNLRNPSYKKKLYLKRQLQSPVTYLIFLIRLYVSDTLAHFEKTEGREILYDGSKDHQIISKMHSDYYLDPETIYIVQKEIPREFFRACRDDIVNDRSLDEYPNTKAEKIRKIKIMIEGSLGIKIAEN